MKISLNSFEYLQPCLGKGEHPPQGWVSLRSKPLLIMVGGMGVGKTTTVKTMAEIGCVFHLLPNRRDLTQRLIVEPLLRQKGKSFSALSRLERLPYIQRYRGEYPAGLAYAISHLWVDPNQTPNWLIFDGLRGEDEVSYVIENMPLARFAVLTVPDLVRLKRLLHRRDPYDQEASNPITVANLEHLSSFASLGVSQACELFSPLQEEELLNLARCGEIDPGELANNLKILCAERSLYDIPAAIDRLQTTAPHRTIIIDTEHRNPSQVAQKLIFSLGDI